VLFHTAVFVNVAEYLRHDRFGSSFLAPICFGVEVSDIPSACLGKQLAIQAIGCDTGIDDELEDGHARLIGLNPG
jgi:hypothetical protein